jgi:hypothetical protein
LPASKPHRRPLPPNSKHTKSNHGDRPVNLQNI